MMTAVAGQPALYGGPVEPTQKVRRVRVQDLIAAKRRGEKWAMLTAYDYSTATLLDAAGIPVLLIGDSAANVVYGYDSSQGGTLSYFTDPARASLNSVPTLSFQAGRGYWLHVTGVSAQSWAAGVGS